MDIYKILSPLDFTVMIGYVIVVIGIGAWVSWRNRQKTEHLFLAQHSLGAPAIGLTMWGTNVGPSMLIASCSIAYTTGMVATNFSWLAFLFIFLLAMVFAPFYRFTRVETLPEFIGKRFNPLSRELLAWYSIVTILVSWLALTLYAGGLLTSQITSWPLWLSVSTLAVVSAFFTVAGGLKTVAHTNVFQMSLLIAASAVLVLAGIAEAGGLGAIAEKTPASYWRLFLPADDSQFPWHAILLGYPVLGVWFWCTDQSMVQAVLGAKTLRTGQYGTNVCAWLKLLDMPLFILPGIICFVLFPDLKNPDEAYMTMVRELLPHGMVGLIMTVLMAALISTIASALNSLSTVFTLDIYVRRFRPGADTAEKVLVGRWVTVAGAVLSVLFALAISLIRGIDLFSLFQAVLGFLAPPLTTVFLVGALWKRATPLAANLILTVGTALSLGIGILYFAKWPSADAWPHFMLLTFCICTFLIVAMVAISLLTPRDNGASGYVSLREALSSDTSSWRGVLVAWGLLITVMISLYVFFN